VLEDLDGRVNVVVFASKFPGNGANGQTGKGAIADINELLEEGRRVFVTGKVDRSRGTPTVLLDDLQSFDDMVRQDATSLIVDVHQPDRLPELKENLAAFAGHDLKLFFRVRLGTETVWVRAGDRYSLSADILGTPTLRELGFSYAIR